MQLMEVQEDLVEDQININQLEVETLVDTLHLKVIQERLLMKVAAAEAVKLRLRAQQEEQEDKQVLQDLQKLLLVAAVLPEELAAAEINQVTRLLIQAVEEEDHLHLDLEEMLKEEMVQQVL